MYSFTGQISPTEIDFNHENRAESSDQSPMLVRKQSPFKLGKRKPKYRPSGTYVLVQCGYFYTVE